MIDTAPASSETSAKQETTSPPAALISLTTSSAGPFDDPDPSRATP